MHIDIRSNGEIKIITIHQKILLSTNISEIEAHVKELLAQGWRNIALSYPMGSFFNSYCIASLVRSHEAIVDSGGTFIIIDPTPEILNFLEMFHIDDTIQTVESEAVLAGIKLKNNIVQH
jgi:anti-anti-sigma regulatory factor